MFLTVFVAALSLVSAGAVVDDATQPLADPVTDTTEPLDLSVRTDLPLCDDCGLFTGEDGAGVQGPAGLAATTGSSQAAPDGSASTPQPAVSTPVATVAGFSLLAVLAAVAYKLRWLSGLFFLIPLFSRIRDADVLEHPLRSQIADFVQENPGAPVKKIQETLGTAHGTAIYHLGLLEKRGILVSQQDGTKRRYWREEDPAARHRRPAVLLARPAYQQIARFVAENPGVNQTALCDALGMRKPAASKRLRRLQDEGLVSVEKHSRRCHYWANDGLGRLLGQRTAVAATA